MEHHLLVAKFPANLKHRLDNFFADSLAALYFGNTQELQFDHPSFEEKLELQLRDF